MPPVKEGEDVCEIHGTVYTFKQDQARPIIENDGAHEETSKFDVGLHEYFDCQKK
ncbi:hypothetical protein J2S09_004685 [Bacillus fengqiuensis]|nr:hypothetical protein [Bacillus fengqiuensis]